MYPKWPDDGELWLVVLGVVCMIGALSSSVMSCGSC